MLMITLKVLTLGLIACDMIGNAPLQMIFK